uniref:Uncharacterized protein n=1 Tax=Arundo donax TaxID=35708 RepID=A0A0A9GHC6_ARUDO
MGRSINIYFWGLDSLQYCLQAGCFHVTVLR